MSFLKKISPEARQYLEKLLREDRYTIDDLFEMFGHRHAPKLILYLQYSVTI